MDLIVCHITADFDTLGAAVGLTCLQPGARIVLAGGAHPAVRDFLALHRDEYPLIERRSVRPEQIRSLTVVDTQLRSRLGKVAEWLDLPQIEITLYDHHLEVERDIPAATVYLEGVGATTTLVVEALQRQQVMPNPIQATVMALGIHVDTGSLTFAHTTPRDARALAWLMEQGASLRAIAEYIDPGLSPTLQQWLTTALDSMETEMVRGYAIAWVLLKLDAFTPGLSSVASRLMDLTEIDALLLGAQYCRGADCRNPKDGDRGEVLTVIGRSRIDGTDLNELFKPVGGGGHPRAASVNLHQVNPQSTLRQLVAGLRQQIPRPLSARELMSSPVRTIRPDTTIDEAQRVLLRYGHSGLSVVDTEGQLVGVISRRDIDIALHHGFSHAPVKGYMTTNLKTIDPDALLPEIESLMVTYDIGRLPVLDNGQLVGIVTRTDVLRQLHREALSNGRSPQASTPTSVITSPLACLSALRQALQPDLWDLLATSAQAAEQRGWHLYLVGGAVRDLLLAMEHPQDGKLANLMLDDIDLVVDGFHRAADVGAGVELAKVLRQTYPQARLEVHGKFQTAALLWHNDPLLDSLWMDIATARTEFYPYPAANPEVEASSIRQDLYRRDFSINALAVRLTAPHAGEVLDFFGGWLDLRSRQIRVLHPNSFIEDPTRIYRAVRFAVRLDFQIDTQTKGYIQTAIASGIYRQIQTELSQAPALQTRLKAELKYILQADYWKPALELLSDLGALQCIHPDLKLGDRLGQQLRLMERWQKRVRNPSGKKVGTPAISPPPIWLSLLEVLLADLQPGDRSLVATNLQLPADSLERLINLDIAETTVQQGILGCDRPSQFVQLLRPYDPPLLMLLAVRHSCAIRGTIWRYLTDWRHVRPAIDGNELKKLGYKPGPQFRAILDSLTAATLDGSLPHRDDALNFLHQHFPNLK